MNYLGCSGYVYDHWQGTFYPASLPKSKWFSYYSAGFNSVEINYSFYRFPSDRTVKRWHRQAPGSFKYTLKASRYITHMKKFKGVKRELTKFYRMSSLLKEKLGCILFQLPPSLHYSEKKLQEITQQLNPKYRNVLEFRHESWFRQEVYKELKKNKIIFCCVSAPRLPEECIKTAQDVYVRFHGRKSWYGTKYSKQELEEWAKKIKKLKAKNNWIYFNNDAYGYAPKNCGGMMRFFGVGSS